MDYTSENHSKHLLVCHLIFVCKYRKKRLLKVGQIVKCEIDLFQVTTGGKLSNKR